MKDIYGKNSRPTNMGCVCGPVKDCCESPSEFQSTSSSLITESKERSPRSDTSEEQMMRKVLKVDLLVIDLSACKRCIPTGAQLRIAVNLLVPVAVVLGIELRLREILVQTPADAKVHALAVIFHIILTEKGLFSHNILT